jgi:hypothetical protein
VMVRRSAGLGRARPLLVAAAMLGT